jgi:hypothetical protein
MSSVKTLTRFLFLSLFCLGSLIFITHLSLPGAAHAQTDQPTPDPTLAALQATVATQQAEIDTLQTELEQTKKDHAFELRDIRWVLDQNLIKWGWVLGVITFLVAFFGLGTYLGIKQKIHQEIRTTLDKELYQLDPTMLTIYLRAGMDKEKNRLELSGLKNIRLYHDFSKVSQRGITIVPVTSEAQEKEFQTFLDNFACDPQKAAFILYATQNYRVSARTLDYYLNLALANTPTTLVNAILAVGRGLKPT